MDQFNVNCLDLTKPKCQNATRETGTRLFENFLNDWMKA